MINILPYQQKKIVSRIRMLRAISTVLVGLFVLIVVCGVLLLPTLVAINDRFLIANNQISLLEKSGAVTNPVDVIALSSRVKTLQSKLAATPEKTPTEYIGAIRGHVPSGMNITGYSFTIENDQPTLKVAGVSPNRETLQRFVAALETLPLIARVESPVANYVKSSNNQFSITITFQ